MPTNGGSSSSSLVPLELSFGVISMGAEVAKDKGGGGGARFGVNLSGGGRFIDVGLFIRPKLDMATKGGRAEDRKTRVWGVGTRASDVR